MAAFASGDRVDFTQITLTDIGRALLAHSPLKDGVEVTLTDVEHANLKWWTETESDIYTAIANPQRF